MKVVAITGKRECGLIDKPEPRVAENFAKVKILVSPMCTEYKDFAGGNKVDMLGHEAAGEVVEISQPGRVKPGDRVVVMPQYPCGTCDLCMAGDYIHCENCVDLRKICGTETGWATYAQYCIKQDWLLIPVSDKMSLEHASMACCGMGPSFGAMQNMAVSAGETVLVTGMGPVGLGAVINGVYRNARVIGVDANKYRAELAMKIGARAVLDPTDPDALRKIKDMTGGKGVDKAIDCTAVPAAQKFVIKATRRRGQVAFVGWGGRIEMDNMIPDGLTLRGSWHWNLRDAPKIMRTIADCASQIEVLITHQFPMTSVKEAFELQCTGNCGKVLLYPFE